MGRTEGGRSVLGGWKKRAKGRRVSGTRRECSGSGSKGRGTAEERVRLRGKFEGVKIRKRSTWGVNERAMRGWERECCGVCEKAVRRRGEGENLGG